ncbi:hypothetical protein THAOC_26228 [Thalassiosira oceanica]|uniref:DUF6820 domain-containing protein n=1 Tax=Thalassiosira oceanica TaxID=159749 RepID=K0RPJ6_THAOC|nr:hypothetical protein THAOC_26228 [Thalassiosira oceanica]|eukprot:EJK54204.1 hypothetical protein THAOC_26228 [Thalassiosira oceanica]
MVPDVKRGAEAAGTYSSIPHLTSVAAGFHRSDVINGSGTSAGRSRLMMSEFAIAPSRLIDNVGRRAIGIALRPQHIVLGDVLGMNIGAMGAIIGPPVEAMEELNSPYRRCAGRAD